MSGIAPEYGRKRMDRAEVSRRLKAARWLAGGTNEKGLVAPLETRDLAQRPQLAENRISANRLEEIEQLKVDARPMELDKIAEAMGLPSSWFRATKVAPLTLDVPAAMEAVRNLAEQIADLEATHAPPLSGTPGTAEQDGSLEAGHQSHGRGTR